jgi:four helix bundle protein
MQDLVIFQKAYDLMLYISPIIDRFPKYEKFALCSQLKNCVLAITRQIIRANKSRNKRPIMYDIDVSIEELRVLVRFAHDRKFLSKKSYAESSRRISEIGRLLGGWIKAKG